MAFAAPALPFLAAGSAAMSALGQIQQSRAQAASAGYNAKVAQNNALIAEQNAGFAGAEGEQKAGIEGLKTKAAYGGTLAREGASGVDIKSPSFENVRTSEAELGKVNAMNIRSNAARQAYGYQTQATSDLAEAQLDRAQQKYAKRSGIINAASTIIGGASKAAMFANMGGETPANVTGVSNPVYSGFLNESDPTGGISTPTGDYSSYYYG